MPSSTASLENLKTIFDYDRNMSLDMEEVGLEQRDEISIRDISYASYAGTSNRRVEVYLIEPHVTGPFAGILFVHPWPGAGRASWMKPWFWRRWAWSPCSSMPPGPMQMILQRTPWVALAEDMKSLFVRTTVDLRRGIDLLASLPGLDQGRLGYVGRSFGDIFGGILSGVEKSVKAFVQMAGTGSFTGVAVLNMPDLSGQRLENYSTTMDPTDPIHYIVHAAPSALFFQFCLKGTFFAREKFIQYYEAGGAASPSP